MADHDDLERFLTAQAPVFEQALGELRNGSKRSHWMWFVFPQLRGLGSSSTAAFYGIGSLLEARAYLAHATLGPRLLLCTQAVLETKGRTVGAIFGSPDDLKFCSSMTLFERTALDQDAFGQALDRFCAGQRDARTLALLEN